MLGMTAKRIGKYRLSALSSFFMRQSSAELLFLAAAAYLGSLFGTIYAAMFMHSYVFSLLCCVIQVSCCHDSRKVCLACLTWCSVCMGAVLAGRPVAAGCLVSARAAGLHRGLN